MRDAYLASSPDFNHKHTISTCMIGDTAISLNKDQYKVVMCGTDCNIVCQACAGSGKTTTMTARIANMIYNQAMPAKEFLVVTFTRNAAKEMTKRIKVLIGSDADNIACGTFHSIAWNTMQPIIKETVTKNHPQYHVDEYQLLFYQYIQQNPMPYRYIFVDEYQDINELQHLIIKELYKHATQLMVVGDEAQNIYSFRKSSSEYIRKFESYFKDKPTKRVELKINYRSSMSIINVANDVLANMKTTIPSMVSQESIDTSPNKSSKPKSTKTIIAVTHHDTFAQEIRHVVGAITGLLDHHQEQSIVILSRNNGSLYKIEEELIHSQISYNFISKNHHCKDNVPVSLSTIHSSKGLEWNYVFIIGMSDVYFPSSKQDVDEERRLFYVAITRARKCCFISYSMNPLMLTRFIAQLDLGLIHMNSNQSLNYVQSSYQQKHRTNIQGCIRSMDGVQFSKLRQTCHLNELNLHKHVVHSQFSMPSFVTQHDIQMEYLMYLQQVVRRSIEKTFRVYHENPDITNMLMELSLLEEDLDWYRERPHLFRKLFIMSNFSLLPSIMDSVKETHCQSYMKPTLPYMIMSTMITSYQRCLNHSLKTIDILFDIFNITKLAFVKKRKGVFYKPINFIDINKTKSHAINIVNFINTLRVNHLFQTNVAPLGNSGVLAPPNEHLCGADNHYASHLRGAYNHYVGLAPPNEHLRGTANHYGLSMLISPCLKDDSCPTWNCSISGVMDNSTYLVNKCMDESRKKTTRKQHFQRTFQISSESSRETQTVHHTVDITQLEIELVISNVMYVFIHSLEGSIPLETIVESLIVATVLNKCTISINTIMFYNSLTGLVHECDVASWRYGDEMLEFMFRSALSMKNNV